MADTRKIEFEAVRRALMGDDEQPGVFEQALGLRAATTQYKGVHLMNDVAQAVLGGAPSHGGDYLCRLIRFDEEGEDNSERALRSDKRFGEVFNQAFPPALGARRVEDLRRAARVVLNFDGGMYQPGTQMASALATHKNLLGFEGFRRFRIGPYVASALTPEGRERLRRLFEDDGDPMTRAFRPLLLEAELVDKQPKRRAPKLSKFDEALGQGLSTLLAQPLSKPALLRFFALGASFGIVLKFLGVGRQHGRPLLLALPAEQEGPTKPLREEAVVSLRRGIEAFDQEIARLLPSHRYAPDIDARARAKVDCIEVRRGVNVTNGAEEILAAARRFRATSDETTKIYWPDQFFIHFGRRAGCVLPRTDRAGWGRHLALTAELMELLILMFVPRGAPPRPWGDFWRAVRGELGIIVGSNASADVAALEEIGIHNVSAEQLAENAEMMLASAVRSGVARRLPDGGAEVGGELS
jgi:hypothetical protein